jgi:D,D-heptose 1,7-bisphosphate phosphatase
LKQLVILAGGLGTRLAAQLGDRPKPLADVAARPVLEHQLELARAHGFDDVRLLIHHRAEAIETALGDGARFGVSLGYHVEREPLGTAGAVLAALPSLAERFVVAYGDTIFDVDLDRMWSHHVESGAAVTLFVHPNDHPHDSDLVALDARGAVTAFYPHPRPPDLYLPNLVNAALYVMDRAALEPWAPPSEPLDFAHDLFPRQLAAGVAIHGYRSREYIKDMGTPERLAKVESDVRSGLIERLALRNAAPAIFLDRDGTLNVEVNYLSDAGDLELLPGIAASIRRMNRAGRLAVVVTNQSVVARGECSEAELERIHAKLETLLGAQGAYLDAIHYCPHHPDKGFAGERPELKRRCGCRKPATGMIDRAIRELHIDTAGSWVIGDSTVDLLLAHNAGLRSVLVRTGHGGEDRKHAVRPDYEFFDLAEATDFILDRFEPAVERATGWLGACAAGDLVALGGLGRSGKSTWAGVFREALGRRGLRAVCVPLDAWLRSEDERSDAGVLGRFDLAAIEAFAVGLPGRTEPVALEISAYDRRTRTRREPVETLVIEPHDVVIVEGVPALAIDTLVAAARTHFYVDCDENERRRRFEREYRLRGFDAAAVAALYEQREVDEHPLIRASAVAADVVILDPDPSGDPE